MKSNKTKYVIFILIQFLVYNKLDAREHNDLFDSANAAYVKSNFSKAIVYYDSIKKMGYESFELYYNLGNAYYKTNNIGKSILNYEKAKKINPTSEDLNFNLDLANQKIEDKLDEKNPMLLSEVKNRFVDWMSEKSWSLLVITFLSLGLLFLLIYFLSGSIKLKQIGFYAAVIFILFSIITFFVAKSKYSSTLNSHQAIILSPSVTILGSPSESGTKLFILHEGAKVNITDEIEDYSEISISSDKTGWIKTSELGLI